MLDSTQTLRTSLKLQFLHSVLHSMPISEIIDGLSITDVIKTQQYLWDLTIEFGLWARGTRFSQREVTRKMIPTTQYQKRMGCTKPEYFCKARECIFIDPDCAIQKIKLNAEVMAESIREYIKIVEDYEILA